MFQLPLLAGVSQRARQCVRPKILRLIIGAALVSLSVVAFLALCGYSPRLNVGMLPNDPHPDRAQYISQFNYAHMNFTRLSEEAVTPNPAVQWGIWQGWGTSLCWFAKVFGQRDDISDILFTLKSTTLGQHSLPGLGMNIARYNAGASGWHSDGGQTMQASPNIPPYRQMEGFWEDWGSSDPASFSWDWTGDINQTAMLRKAHARGANLFELFSNSPMWWMNYNDNPSGSTDGRHDNLQTWSQSDHAEYLADIAIHAAENWGLNFHSIEPFNEPMSTWWKADNNQEGCHFEHSTQAEVVGRLYEVIQRHGLHSTVVAASDENTYDLALATWNRINATTRAQIGKVNVHGYQQGGGRRDLLYTAVDGKPLWNSEYGDGDATGMSLARNLNFDFQYLHNTAWVYWQALDSGGWGLIQSNLGDVWIGDPNPKFYVLLQYTRHIRPGMVIIDSCDPDTVAAYDEINRKLILVTTNYGRTARWINYSLSRFTKASGPITRWCTNAAGADFYKEYHDTDIHDQQTNRTFWSYFEIHTTQTFEVEGVDIDF